MTPLTFSVENETAAVSRRAVTFSRPFMDGVVLHETARWRPKLTPYRFLTLLTTVGLGGAKAYAVSKNLPFVATSIEWVASVIIFSMSKVLAYTLHILSHAIPFTVFSFLACPNLARLAPSNG